MPTITALRPSGLAVTVDVATLDQVEAAVADLRRRGDRPATRTGEGWARTPDGLPLGPRHHVPMRPREKPGDTWYSHQVPDPRTGALLYCRGDASPSRPGWTVPAEASTRP